MTGHQLGNSDKVSNRKHQQMFSERCRASSVAQSSCIGVAWRGGADLPCECLRLLLPCLLLPSGAGLALDGGYDGSIHHSPQAIPADVLILQEHLHACAQCLFASLGSQGLAAP